MNLIIGRIIAFSIAIPATLGLFGFKKSERSFLPFLWLIWISLLNELISFIVIRTGHSNAVNYNAFTLAEGLLITWQFNKWKLFERLQLLYKGVLFVFVATWITEMLFISSVTAFLSYFIILRSLVIVLISINALNRLIVKEQSNLLKDSVFLICIGFVFSFTYAMLVEIFLMYGINESEAFMSNVYIISNYIGLFANVLFTLAILWMPRRQVFIRPA